jgi:hypothetical protein
MHGKKYFKEALIIVSLSFCVIRPVYAADIIETVGGLNNLLYGVAAGIAALMISLHAVKWKTADNPLDREEAKKGIINVILALILIMSAAAVISVIYVTPPEDEPSTTTRTPTTHAPPTTRATTTTTSTVATTTTTSTTSTTTTTLALTAANLATCIINAGGMLYTDPATCATCQDNEAVWTNEGTAPVGPGKPELDRITQTDSGSVCEIYIPCWKYKSSGQTRSDAGCRTFEDLNILYNCHLAPVAGHTYQSC